MYLASLVDGVWELEEVLTIATKPQPALAALPSSANTLSFVGSLQFYVFYV